MPRLKSYSLFCLLAISVALGCGGEGEKTPVQTGAASAPQTTQVQPTKVNAVTPKQVGGVTPAQEKKPSPKQTAEIQESSLPPGVKPEDVFEVSAAAHEVEITISAKEAATFEIISKPVPGTNSSTFANPNPPAASNTNNSVQPGTRRNVGGGNRKSEEGEIPKNFKPKPGAGVDQETGLALRLINEKDGAELILIPAGITIRGSTTGPRNTRPEHQVFLNSYYISEHEVSLEQYRKYREEAKSGTRARTIPVPLNDSDPANMPALGVPQNEARKYAEWAGGQLPTEAQWEKAARGPEGYKYPWGNGRPTWPTKRDPRKIEPVKSYAGDISPYGVYDLAGNAREWTLDVYAEDAFERASPGGQKLLENPTGPQASTRAYGRVVKGGDDWKTWNRSEARFTEELPDVGFRYILPIQPVPEEGEPDENERKRSTRS